eukprot:scaffold2499_cov125-Cylindrotheca_fusiformis.AAC.9
MDPRAESVPSPIACNAKAEAFAPGWDTKTENNDDCDAIFYNSVRPGSYPYVARPTTISVEIYGKMALHIVVQDFLCSAGMRPS